MALATGWGRYPKQETEIKEPRTIEQLREIVLSDTRKIARGAGRAYSDSAIGLSTTISTKHLNQFESFDAKSGQLVAGAGVTLADILEAMVPRGWFLGVTPGTKYVTLGGAIAADVHGKNHHRDGSFRTTVLWVELMGADGTIARCSATENPDLFDRTLGGMGLTGVITRCAIQLRPVESAWIAQETLAADTLGDAIALMEQNLSATYSVAWIDCLSSEEKLGRSIIMLGEHASVKELSPQQALTPLITKKRAKLKLPFDLPAWLLNGHVMRAFNAAYFAWSKRRAGKSIVDYDRYFYPLDAVLGWNRVYGRRGFVQFQCVLPLKTAEQGLTDMLAATSQANAGSFLAVLKRMGPQESAMSFPMEGYTLALDFPVSDRTKELVTLLHDMCIDHGGRVYLAKDVLMSAEQLRESDPRIAPLSEKRAQEKLTENFQSHQSERLSL